MLPVALGAGDAQALSVHQYLKLWKKKQQKK